MDKRKVSFVYRLLVIASLGTGIYLNIYKTTSLMSILSYFTLQVNIICLFSFIFFEIADIAKRNYRKHELYYVVKGALIIAVILMATTYWMALAPNQFEMDRLHECVESRKLRNILVHEVSPILVILDYLLFDEKRNFKLYYPIVWLLIPLNYTFYVYAYSAAGGKFYGIGGSREFAYIFFDYKKIGYEGVLYCMAFLTFVILILGYVMVLVDKILAKQKK